MIEHREFMWPPITLEEIQMKISDSEPKLEPEVRTCWDLIKVAPSKWKGGQYGTAGGGFWIVALLGQRVIWYNDIEEGFNVSHFETYGEIMELGYEQSELHEVVRWIWQRRL